MADSLDMSLDDLIKRRKKSGNFRARREGGLGRGRGSGGAGRAYNMSYGPGPTRRSSVLGPFRTTPYLPPPGLWMPETGMVEEGASNAAANAETKLYVSNLYYGVTNVDIKVLFSDVGEVKRYSIHYDWSGRSKGTAEVVFSRRSDALKAIKRYNDLRLDGRPMKIEIVGGDFVPSALPPASEGSLGYQRGAIRSNSRDGFKRGGDRGQGGQGKRYRTDSTEKVSAEALDADLEKYHQDAILCS